MVRCPSSDQKASRLVKTNINRRAIEFTGKVQEQNSNSDGLSHIVNQLIGLDEDGKKGWLALQTRLVMEFSAGAAQLGAFERSFDHQFVITWPDLLRYLNELRSSNEKRSR